MQAGRTAVDPWQLFCSMFHALSHSCSKWELILQGGPSTPDWPCHIHWVSAPLPMTLAERTLLSLSHPLSISGRQSRSPSVLSDLVWETEWVWMLSSRGRIRIRIGPENMQTADIGFFASTGQLQCLCEVKYAFWLMGCTTNSCAAMALGKNSAVDSRLLYDSGIISICL